MKLIDDLYLVLDLPKPVSEQVLAARLKYEPARYSLPAEITIIGSSGVGTIRTDQNPDVLESCLNRLAETTSPITSNFVDVRSFPGTEIFWFSVVDPNPFFELQKKIAGLDIKFNPMAHGFCPHCTIADLEGAGPEEHLEVLKLEVPRDTFVLDCISLYSLNEHWDCRLLWQSKLKGSIQPNH